MLIDSSYDDIYSDETAAKGLTALNQSGVEWNGRRILSTKDNHRIKSILAISLAHKNTGGSKIFPKDVSGRKQQSKAAFCDSFFINPFLPTSFNNVPPAPAYIPPPPPPPRVFVPPPPPPPVFIPKATNYNPPPIVPPTQPPSLSNLPPPIVHHIPVQLPSLPPPVVMPTFATIDPIKVTPIVNLTPPAPSGSTVSAPSQSFNPTSIYTPNTSQGFSTLNPLSQDPFPHTAFPNHAYEPSAISSSPSVPSAQKQNAASISKAEAVADFTKGFLKGLPQGSLNSVKNVPSTIFTLAKAAGNYVLDPAFKHILPGQELIHLAIAVPETISDLVTCNYGELAKAVVPEVHKLCTNWDNLSHEERGSLMGYCVGEYGTDFVLLPAAAVKGLKVAGGILKEASTLGKIEGAISAATKEVEAVEAVIGSSKLAKGSTPLVAEKTIVQQYLASEELKKDLAEVLANTEKALQSETFAEGKALATKEAASLEARINTAGAQVGKEDISLLKEPQKLKPPVRTEPRTLQEQLVLNDAQAGGGREIGKLTIKDPRYPTELWMKKECIQYTHDGKQINVHYWEHRFTGERTGFKFKND